MSDKNGEAPSLAELQKLIEEIGDKSIDSVIAATEKRLKMLRSLRTTVGVTAEPTPRTRKSKGAQEPATT